jgi:thioredoxin-like negative regulator of GroEL
MPSPYANRQNLAEALLRGGRRREALEALWASLEAEPGELAAAVRLQALLLEAKDYEGALRVVETVAGKLLTLSIC